MVLPACDLSHSFSDTPTLKYQSYSLIGAEEDPVFPLEHADIQLYFTDGDGDIGLKTFAPGEFNLLVSVFEKHDSEYVYVYDWSGILKDLADEGQQNKSLEGVITYKVGLADVVVDTARIEFELIDDAGHSSGVIQTEPIYVHF